MRCLVLFSTLMCFSFTIGAQENLIVKEYIILKAEQQAERSQSKPWEKSEVDIVTHTVPTDEVWRIESVLCMYQVPQVSLIIDGESFVIGQNDQDYSYLPAQLPFYLPSGTKFQLSAKENKGLVSIAVLKLN